MYTLNLRIVLADLWIVMRGDIARLARSDGGWHGTAYWVLSLGTAPPSPTSDRRDRRIILVLGVMGVPVAPVVHAGVGSIFAVLTSQPLWYAGLYPVMFLVPSLASGAALLTLEYAILAPRDERYRPMVLELAKLTRLLLVLDCCQSATMGQIGTRED